MPAETILSTASGDLPENSTSNEIDVARSTLGSPRISLLTVCNWPFKSKLSWAAILLSPS
jgi:hypothetical protein